GPAVLLAGSLAARRASAAGKANRGDRRQAVSEPRRPARPGPAPGRAGSRGRGPGCSTRALGPRSAIPRRARGLAGNPPGVAGLGGREPAGRRRRPGPRTRTRPAARAALPDGAQRRPGPARLLALRRRGGGRAVSSGAQRDVTSAPDGPSLARPRPPGRP